jgi:hypothetical protein
MTRYLTEERFIVQSNDKESLRNYRDGWERTFGENTEDPIDAPAPRYSCEACCDTGCVVDPNADPSTFVTEADGLVNCDECSIRGKQLP